MFFKFAARTHQRIVLTLVIDPLNLHLSGFQVWCIVATFQPVRSIVTLLLGYLVGYVHRTFDVFCDQRQNGTPLEKMRGARGGQKPSSFPFGRIGFVKPVLLEPWKGQRMMLCTYLGMRYVTVGGVLAFSVNQDSNGQWEMIRGHSFRAREGVQYDVIVVWPLLSGVRPNDPNVAPSNLEVSLLHEKKRP